MADLMIDGADVDAGSSTGQGDPNAQPNAQGDPNAPPADGGTPQVPKGFVPIHRLQEQSRTIQELRSQLAELQSRPQPAAPRQPAAPVATDPESEAIKERLFTLVPELKVVVSMMAKDPELFDKILKATQVVPQVEQDMAQRWTAHGANAIRILRAEGSRVVGQDLSPEAQRFHEAAFIASLETDREKQARYIQGDLEALVKEYWQEVNSHVYDPIRRKAVVAANQRGERIARVPSAGPGTGALGKGGVKPKTEDDLHDAAWDRLQQERSG